LNPPSYPKDNGSIILEDLRLEEFEDMMRMKPDNRLLGLLTFGLVTIGLISTTATTAMARSSGGRSSGGSFSSPSRSSAPSSSSPSRSSASPPRSSGSGSSGNGDRPYAVPVPVPQYPSYPRYPSGGGYYPNGGGYYPNSGGGYYPNSSNSDFNRSNNGDQTPILPNNDSVGGAILDDAVIDNTPPTSVEDFTQKAMTPLAPPTPNATPATNPAIAPNQDSGANPAWLLLPGAAVAGGAGLMLYSANRKKGKLLAAAAPGSSAEIHNISTVQVALLANSPIQQQLTEIVETMEIETPEQLKEQLQAVVIALLRLTEFWSHAKVASQTFPDRVQAESFFSQGSMQERAKLSEETLTRDSFGLREKPIVLPEGEDPAAYVVVTLRLGTTHDRPLFETVHSAAELKAIFDKLAAMTTPELLTFELIWSPQESSDSLSRDELLTEYGDLVMV
jgi:uncharacterized membrane protein